MMFERPRGAEKCQEICCVMIDEAGLPPEEKHPLKVLHYYTDKPVVSSVIITNSILDAAKTNRTVRLASIIHPQRHLMTSCRPCFNFLRFHQLKIFAVLHWQRSSTMRPLTTSRQSSKGYAKLLRKAISTVRALKRISSNNVILYTSFVILEREVITT